MSSLERVSSLGRASVRALVFAAVGLVAVEGCTVLSAIDRTRIPYDDGDHGHSGGGGHHSTSVATASTSGMGGGVEFECADVDVVTACGLDTTCRSFACVDGACVVSAAPAGTPCDDDNGIACDGKGNCLDAHCGNGAADANETDVDCGGATCPPCTNGDSCESFDDCKSGVCATTSGSGGAGGDGGAAPSIGICSACAASSECQLGSFCDFAAGGICSPRRAVAEVCNSSEACASEHCVDGVCCATSCDGTCLACHESKTGMPSGSCQPVVAGMDPDAECPASAADCLAGGCRGGLGACARATSGTMCRPAAGPCDLPESCDDVHEGCPADGYAGPSDGSCVAPHVCDGLGAGAEHCKLPPGEACGSDDECLLGNCTAGSCN